MKRITSLLIIFVLMLSSAAFAAGESGINVYVSSIGSDLTGDGSEQNPFASIKKAKEYVADLDKSEPINVIFKEGTYRINNKIVFKEGDSGVEGAPVTYMAEDGADVVFTGAVTVNKDLFQDITDVSILKRLPQNARGKVLMLDLTKQGLSATSTFPSLYVNDAQATIARYPNNDYAVATASGTNEFSIDYENAANWKAENVFLKGSLKNGYVWTVTNVESISENTLTLSDTIRNGAYFYVLNLIEELDAPGEYVIKDNILYYYPLDSLENLDMEIIDFSGSTMFEIRGAEYINFDGITFEKSNSSAIIIPDDAWTNDINITNCNFNYLISTALEIRGFDCTISDNYSYGCGSRFIEFRSGKKEGLVPGNIIIKNNRIIGAGSWGHSIVGTIKGGIDSHENWYCIGNTIENNIIQDCNTASAINVTGNDNVIRYNEIINQGRIIEDGGAIYMGRAATKYGSEVAYNYIHDFNKENYFSALYSDDGFSGLVIHHNVIENVSRAMISGLGMNNQFYDNLMINVTSGMGLGTRMNWNTATYGENGTMYEEAYNVVYNSNPLISETYNTKYPQIKVAVDNHINKGYPFFAPWNTVVTGNVSIGSADAISSRPYHKYRSGLTSYTIKGENKVPGISDAIYYSGITAYVDELKAYGLKYTAADGTDLNGTSAGNPKLAYSDNLFVNASEKNYTLTSQISDVSTVHEIDMTKIGVLSTTNPKILENQKNSLKLYDASYDTKKAVISWEKTEKASEYDIVVSKNADLSSPIYSETSNNTYFNNNYTFDLDGEGTYYYKVTARGLSREDMFALESEIGQFTVGSAYTASFDNALSVLENELANIKAGNYSYGESDASLQSVYDSITTSSLSSQEDYDNAEEWIYTTFMAVEGNLVVPEMEITRFEPDMNTTTVYVEAKGLPANSLASVVVTNPETTIDSALTNASVSTMRYMDTVLADDKGCISLAFDTSRNEIDYTGAYEIYITNSEGNTLKESYTYGTVELSDVTMSDSTGKAITKETLSSYKGQTVTLSMSVKNRTSRTITPESYLGVYESGALKDAFVENQTPISANSDGVISVPVVVPENYTDSTEFKLFMWDDLKLLRPLTKTRLIFE